MISETIAQADTVTAVRTGRSLLRSVSVKQLTEDAPKLFLQIFNVASGSVTLGTTLPDVIVPVPAGETGRTMHGRAEFQGIHGGLDMATAISYAVTTTATGSTAPDAGDEPNVKMDWERIG